FLEHSRIYSFANGGRPEVFLGSADLMERNLDRRVEVLCPVRHAGNASHLRDVVLDAYLKDNARAYRLVDGRYTRASAAAGEPRVSAQRVLLELYTNRPVVEEPEDAFESKSAAAR